MPGKALKAAGGSREPEGRSPARTRRQARAQQRARREDYGWGWAGRCYKSRTRPPTHPDATQHPPARVVSGKARLTATPTLTLTLPLTLTLALALALTLTLTLALALALTLALIL